MQKQPSLPGGMPAAEFLRDHWQKKPLLARGAFPGFRSPIAPEELAGLACCDDVESRLIVEEEDGALPWTVRHGPFREQEFSSLPERRWTLLVQEVDRHVPEVAAVLDAFRFIPNWRIDDLMVSYAVDGGSVGAHVDRYDVFLLQASGRRRWGVIPRPVVEERLVPGVELRVLSDFEPEVQWELEPGDMLYLPPRVAHHGVALGNCMTFSIGFRAPAVVDLAAGYLAELVQTLDPEAFYEDPDLQPQADPGRIDVRALDRVARLLGDLTADRERLQEWFGRFMTEPRREQQEIPLEQPLTADELTRRLAQATVLRRSSLSRFSFVDTPDGGALLFVGGQTYRLSPALTAAAPLLTGTRQLDRTSLREFLGNDSFTEIVTELINHGFLILEQG